MRIEQFKYIGNFSVRFKTEEQNNENVKRVKLLNVMPMSRNLFDL